MRALGLGLAWAIRRLAGVRARSRLLHALSFGAFNKAFSPARTEYDCLSRDPAEVDKFVNDPACGFVVTAQHWFDHLVALGASRRGRPHTLRAGQPRRLHTVHGVGYKWMPGD
jgi:alpha-beta hydrolase superfamily lysophospholipase